MAYNSIENIYDRPGHYIVSEAANIYRSREQGFVAAGAGKLTAGMVLKSDGAGKWVPFDGTGTAARVLFESCDATAADARRTMSVRDTEVQVDVLQWMAGVTDVQKTAALASLAAAGIIGR